MAEFCLACWNKINGTNDSPQKYLFSDEPELCEGCGKQKRIIITERKSYYKSYYRYKLRFVIAALKIVCIFALIILSCLVFIHKTGRS